MLWWLRVVVGLVVALLTVLVQLLVLLVPALFQVFVWLTLPLFALLTQVTGWQPARGALIVFACLGWAAASLGFLPLVNGIFPTTMAWVCLLTVGGCWGLCVGYQAALRWEADHLRLPNTDPRQFGLPSHFFGGADTAKRTSKRVDELLREGIILGETDD